MFYCGKGARPVMGVSMAESCEEALDRLIDTCHKYRSQCEEYRNNAITGEPDILRLVLLYTE